MGSKYKANKYNVADKAQRTWVGTIKGEKKCIVFDSKKEMQYFLTFRYMEIAGQITGLELQVPFKITPKRKYIADFTFISKTNDSKMSLIKDKSHIVDVKGYETDLFKLKWELMQINYKDRIFVKL